MKKMFKHILRLFGYKIISVKNKLLINIYNTDFKQNVLISFLRSPFINGINYSHTNLTECNTAALIFAELGYNVDVISFDDNVTEIEFCKYNIIYGFGFALENSFYAANSEKILKILYSTGCNIFYSNYKSAIKIKDFFIKTGKMIPTSGRLTEFSFPLQFTIPDFAIILGNKISSNTFLSFNPKIRFTNQNLFYFDVCNIDLNHKNFEVAKLNFIWFGSNGLLHKGLDILIDYFSTRKDITLHICGASTTETKFFEHYKSNYENILYHGFVDIHSEKFKLLMNECASCIFPSISEGSSPSVLNVVANGGLIPIISKYASLDVLDWGYLLEEADENSLSKIIDHFLALKNQAIFKMAQAAQSHVRRHYTLENYKQQLKENIKSILSSHENLSY